MNSDAEEMSIEAQIDRAVENQRFTERNLTNTLLVLAAGVLAGSAQLGSAEGLEGSATDFLVIAALLALISISSGLAVMTLDRWLAEVDIDQVKRRIIQRAVPKGFPAFPARSGWSALVARKWSEQAQTWGWSLSALSYGAGLVIFLLR